MQQLLNNDWGQSERRLVQHHQLRAAHHAAADGEHLLLPAGEGTGELFLPLAQARKQGEYFGHSMFHPRTGARQHGADLEILHCRERWKELAPFGYLADAEITYDMRIE